MKISFQQIEFEIKWISTVPGYQGHRYRKYRHVLSANQVFSYHVLIFPGFVRLVHTDHGRNRKHTSKHGTIDYPERLVRRTARVVHDLQDLDLSFLTDCFRDRGETRCRGEWNRGCLVRKTVRF